MIRSGLAALLFAATAVFGAADATAKPRDAEAWVALSVAPALVKELATHPRFRGETIRVVVFADDRPAASSNAFALSLRNRLSRAIFDTPGIRMAADRGPNERLDCTLDDVDYYIGLQMADLGQGEYRIDLRTLDVADQTWVTGFDLTWQGALSESQENELDEPRVDPWFRGARLAPYDPAQADVLAAELAQDLACQSLRQFVGDYVVWLETDGDRPPDHATALVGNNLAALASVRFTDDPALANAVLRGESHRVDAGLDQYWATITPTAPDSALPTLSASAYVKAQEPPADPIALLASTQAVLSPASLVDVDGQGVVMQVRARQDAVVFFLNHQQRYGLVRLAGPGCRTRPDARVLRSDETVNRTLPVSSLEPDAASATDGWSLAPAGDTYYAVAVSDSAAAHVLARHIRRLPQRCTSAARFGLRDAELRDWLTEFAGIVEQQREHVDWQAIQVRNVY